MKVSTWYSAAIFLSLSFLLAACKATVPTLPEMRAQKPVETTYTSALADLNTVLEVYLPPDYQDTYFYVKPISDATGISQTGEIPMDITSLVRDAVAQVYYKVRYVEQYDQTDIIQIQAELLKLQTNKLQGLAAKPAQRPPVDFTITGRISQFDRNLESQSDKARAMANVGTGLSRTDASASGKCPPVCHASVFLSVSSIPAASPFRESSARAWKSCMPKTAWISALPSLATALASGRKQLQCTDVTWPCRC